MQLRKWFGRGTRSRKLERAAALVMEAMEARRMFSAAAEGSAELSADDYFEMDRAAVGVAASSTVKNAPAADSGPIARFVAGFFLILADGTASFLVTYSDEQGVSVSSIDPGDVSITGPSSFSSLGAASTVAMPTDGPARSVEYRFNAPGASWDAADSGQY